MNPTREQRRELERENARWPLALIEIPRFAWPPPPPSGRSPGRVLRSREFLMQVFDEALPALFRLSVCRAALASGGERWVDGISWDELQRLKREAGYGDYDAVEIYPRDGDIVNAANMRHLWVMSEPRRFGWSLPA